MEKPKGTKFVKKEWPKNGKDSAKNAKQSMATVHKGKNGQETGQKVSLKNMDGGSELRGRPRTGRRNPIAAESDLRNAANARNHREATIDGQRRSTRIWSVLQFQGRQYALQKEASTVSIESFEREPREFRNCLESFNPASPFTKNRKIDVLCGKRKAFIRKVSKII
ncbi:hypothetical protein WN48_01311 [Eufriesea mexicana]|uniref:Uncharacterized protein n=1 Tax=Eufriesea mexicana TaxID=516756 RepID=A0A310SGL9_9HYME|nr:hypothetical protein WN48_01311 [Eufriesea mexicana]